MPRSAAPATPEHDFTDPKTVEALVNRRHPEFAAKKTHWAFCEQSFRGGREYLCEDNVFRFYKEGPAEYADRLKRTYRANSVKRVVETFNQYLFKQRPLRAPNTPDHLTRFWKRASKAGQAMDQWVKAIDQWLSVFGVLYVVVDRPAEIANTRREEKLPYGYLVFPTHVPDLSYGEDDKLAWIIIAEDFRDDANPATSSGAQRVRLRLWTRTEWYLFEPDSQGAYVWAGRDRGYSRHDLGEVPVIPVLEGEGTRYSAPALIDDIAYMDRTLVNYGSLLDEILYEQTYSQLTMPAEGILPGTTAASQMVAAAKERVFLFAGGDSNNRPAFISPDASQASLLITAIQDLRREIYASTGADAGDANSSSMSKGREYASGKVRMMDHSAIENRLLTKAQALERLEDEVARLVLVWMGQPDATVDPDWVRYPEKFDVRGLLHDLEIALQLNEVAPPAEVMRAHMKGLTEKLFPRLKPAEMAAMHAAIDAWTPVYKTEQALAETVGVKIPREQMALDAAQAERDRAAAAETARVAAEAATKTRPAARPPAA